MIDKQKYNFITFTNDNNYRYYCQKYDKKLYHKYIQSYSSEALDLNKQMKEKVLQHRRILDKAIASVENQMKRGFTDTTIIYPFELRKEYQWYVKQFVKNKLKLAKTQKDTNGSQKYWVPVRAVKTYGFRDKDLTSKFQCFIEFISADKNEQSTIKLNLNMSKKAYENRHLLYLDGFDLVFKQNSIFVRHVSEKLVKAKKDNGITKYMTIDAWSNIQSITIDSNVDTKSVRALYKLSDEDELIYGITHRTHNSKSLRKTLARVKSMKSKETFYTDSKIIENAIHSKVRALVNRDDESKIVLYIPEDIQSNLYDIIKKKFISSVKDECKKYGIKVETQYERIDNIKSSILKYRQKSNEVAKGFKPYKEKQLKAHLKWSEIAIAAILYNYKDFYPALLTNGKSITELGESTEKHDSQVLKLEKPAYVKLFDCKRLCTIDDVCDEVAARAMWLSEIKRIAQEYFERWKKLQNNQEQLDISKTTDDFTYDEPVFI